MACGEQHLLQEDVQHIVQVKIQQDQSAWIPLKTEMGYCLW